MVHCSCSAKKNTNNKKNKKPAAGDITALTHHCSVSLSVPVCPQLALYSNSFLFLSTNAVC